jgi:hypothetical protein
VKQASAPHRLKSPGLFHARTEEGIVTRPGSCVMNVASLSQDLYGFAIELRQLAYTMPGGQEDPLIHLSERMVHHAQQQATEGQR